MQTAFPNSGMETVIFDSRCIISATGSLCLLIVGKHFCDKNMQLDFTSCKLSTVFVSTAYSSWIWSEIPHFGNFMVNPLKCCTKEFPCFWSAFPTPPLRPIPPTALASVPPALITENLRPPAPGRLNHRSEWFPSLCSPGWPFRGIIFPLSTPQGDSAVCGMT